MKKIRNKRRPGFTLVELLVSLSLSSLLLVFFSYIFVRVYKTNQDNIIDSRTEYQVRSLFSFAKNHTSYLFSGGKENKDNTSVFYIVEENGKPVILFDNKEERFVDVTTTVGKDKTKQLSVSYLIHGKRTEIQMFY